MEEVRFIGLFFPPSVGVGRAAAARNALSAARTPVEGARGAADIARAVPGDGDEGEEEFLE